MTGAKPCTRCLLQQAGNSDMAALIKERVAVIPAEEKTPEAEYSRRLNLCLSCEALSGGLCMKCGCYVELRAARKTSRCPAAIEKW